MIDMTRRPVAKLYGYEEPTNESEGGWMLEGGEEAYFNALLRWEQAQELITMSDKKDAPQYTYLGGALYTIDTFSSYTSREIAPNVYEMTRKGDGAAAEEVTYLHYCQRDGDRVPMYHVIAKP